jgi:IS30 family transposase
MRYQRLSPVDRYQIEAGLESGLSLRAIAKKLGRSPSSISREISKCKGTYRAEEANRETLVRLGKRIKCSYKIKGSLKDYVCNHLAKDWSPEQVAGRIARHGLKHRVSHQTIYRFLEREKQLGSKLWKHLRILRKQRHDRKKASWKPEAERITGRTWIDARPSIVEERIRLGDFERDTLCGKINGSVLLTLVDRTSRLLKIVWVARKDSISIHDATLRALRNEFVCTITNDNGCEFARHENTAQSLNAKIYFSRSYRSWERGSNENANGLLRQYFPRRTDIGRPSADKLRAIESRINDRPKKCLGFQTPNEVHRKLRSKVLR